MASEKPSGAVPRSSAMTRQRGAVALEPQGRQHRLERISHVGALGRRRAARDQEQPLQLEGVVDADRAGVAHVGARRAPGRPRVPVLSSASGSKGGRPQFWPCGPSGSGGAPTDSAGANRSGAGPDLRAARIGADGEIAIEADAHARRARARSAARRAACPPAIAARHGRRCAPVLRREVAHRV